MSPRPGASRFSFKPFIYSAALEKASASHGGQRRAAVLRRGRHRRQPWEPKNYDGKYDGPMTMRTGLARSKNMISIRVLQAVGHKTAGMGQPVWLRRRQAPPT